MLLLEETKERLSGHGAIPPRPEAASVQCRKPARRIRALHVIESLRGCGGTPIKLFRTSVDIADRIDSRFVCLSEIGSVGRALARRGIPVTLIRRNRANPAIIGNLLDVIDRGRIDLVCTHFARAGIWGRIAAVCAGRPVIHFFHGQIRKGPHYRFMEHALGRLTAMVVANSRATANFVAGTTGIPRNRIRISYPYVDFTPQPHEDSPDGVIRIGNIAGLNPYKGHDVLLKAFSTLAETYPRAILKIVGDGPLRGRLERLAYELGIAKKVSFLGYRADVAEILSGFDMFVFPSVSEGFGIAAVEAMIAGVPVVCSDAGALPEIVTHGRTGLIARSGDPGALAEVMAEMIRDPGKAETLAAKGRQEARERFCRANRGQYARIMLECLGNPSAVSPGQAKAVS